MHTDFPEPVVPAISKCGIFAKFKVLISPVVVLPIAKVSKDFALANSVLFTTDLKKTLVYTSSVATLGLNDNLPSNEDTPVKFSDMVGDYKKSKYLAERIVDKFIQKKIHLLVIYIQL